MTFDEISDAIKKAAEEKGESFEKNGRFVPSSTVPSPEITEKER